MSDRLFLWLKYVDRQLSDGALDYLKFGLHSMLRCHYTEVEELNKPSLLYHFLQEHRRDQSETEVLQIFLYALKMLGNKLRGGGIINKGFGKGSFYKLIHPGQPANLSKEFKFYMCLLKISTKVRKDGVLKKKMIHNFTRRELMDTNHRHVKTLVELLTLLCQNGFLAPDNTLCLQKVLVKYKALECLGILKNYHQSVAMALMPEAEEVMLSNSGR
jgi:hypothetical protein